MLEDRHGARSTIVTSQLHVESWHDYIAHPTIAEAVLNRLVHNAHKITMKGPSRRQENAQATVGLTCLSLRSDIRSRWTIEVITMR